MARDRVGIVYDVTRVISDMQGDLADTRQQVLQGYLTMILHASFPATVTEQEVRQRLTAIRHGDHPRFDVLVKSLQEIVQEEELPADAYVLTARGQDRIGFLATVAGFCASQDINILDLATMVSDGSYVMILLVDPGPVDRMDAIREALAAFNRKNDLNLVLQHHDIFRATNEIRML